MQKDLAEQKFRPLKRQLQKLFREMQFSLSDGAAPTDDMVDEFIRQVEIMVSYPGFGDENYPAFLDTVRRLGHLKKDTTLSVWQQLLDDITKLRQRCHESFRTFK
jgi:XXXCH domain-containing protein